MEVVRQPSGRSNVAVLPGPTCVAQSFARFVSFSGAEAVLGDGDLRVCRTPSPRVTITARAAGGDERKRHGAGWCPRRSSPVACFAQCHS